MYLAAKLTGIETLQSGGTTILDHILLTPGDELACLDAVVRAYREIGIRAVVAPLVFDLEIHQTIGGGPTNINLDEQKKRTKAVLDWMAIAVEKCVSIYDSLESLVDLSQLDIIVLLKASL